jgi:hypothetical protein
MAGSVQLKPYRLRHESAAVATMSTLADECVFVHVSSVRSLLLCRITSLRVHNMQFMSSLLGSTS